MPEYVVIDGWQPEGENEPRIPALMRKLGYRSATFKMSVINPSAATDVTGICWSESA